MSEQPASSLKEDKVKRPRSWSRWLWPVLIVSVALNLLVIGAIGGFMARNRGAAEEIGGVSLLAYMHSLPRQRRQEIEAATGAVRPALKPLRRKVREARRAAQMALLADPFNRQIYAAAVAQRLKALVSLREAVNAIAVKIGASLNAEERRGFVEWRRHRRFYRWRKRRFRRWRD